MGNVAVGKWQGSEAASSHLGESGSRKLGPEVRPHYVPQSLSPAIYFLQVAATS